MAAGKIITVEEVLRSSGSELAELYEKHVNPEMASLLRLANMDKFYSRAEGVVLYDDAGRDYLDFTSGYGALNLGHNHPEVLAAMRAASRLPAVLLVGYNKLMGAVASNLASLLPGDLSMTAFGNGGAEAVEIAMKMARGSTGRKGFVSCRNGYHGLTFGALSVGGVPRYCDALGPLMDGCRTIPFGDLGALEAQLREKDVAGFIVEPIQGEGGCVVPPKEYLKGAREICERFGTLMILDEIQTGFGRTGRMFAMENYDVVPDIVTLSKSLSAGASPMSVAVTTERVWRKAFGSKDRFDLVISTYGGNPVSCAAALKSMEVLVRDDLPARAAELGRYARRGLAESLSKHQMVQEIRGEGLFLGVRLRTDGLAGAILKDSLSAIVISPLLNEHGIMTSYYDLDPSVIRFEPPLIVTKEQIDKAVGSMDAVLSKGKLKLTMSLAKNAIGRTMSRS